MDTSKSRGVSLEHATGRQMCAIIFILVATLYGCSSVLYHDLIATEYKSSAWLVKFQMDEINWLVSAGGDSAKLTRKTRDTAEIEYYKNYTPDAENGYYILTVRAEKQKSDTSALTMFRGVASFESLVLIYGGQEKTLDLESMRQRHFSYSGSDYCGLEPIPIPNRVKDAALRVAVRIKVGEESAIEDMVRFTLPIKKKRLTHTLINAWP